MNGVKEQLDRRARSFQPSPDAWERVESRVRMRQRTRRLGAGVLAMAVFAGAAIGAWAAFHPRSTERPATTRLVSTTFRIDGGLTDVAFGDGSLWVPSFGKVFRLYPATGAVRATIIVPGESDYRYVAVGEGGVWVTDSGTTSVYRIDPLTDRIVATIKLDAIPTGIAAGLGKVWVASPGVDTGEVIVIDPEANEVIRRIKAGSGPGPIAVGEDAVWVINTNDGGSLMRIDRSTLRVTGEWFVNQSPRAVAFGAGSVWVSVHPFIARLDPATGRVTGTFGALGVFGLLFEHDLIWGLRQPSSTAPGVVNVFDAGTGRQFGEIRVGMTPVAITVGAGAVWVANYQDSTLTRIELAG